MGGPETRTTCSGNLHAVMQFLDAIFQVPPLAIDLFVEPLGTLLHIGDHKTRIVFRIAVGMASDFRLIDDAPLILPSLLRFIAKLSVDVLGLSTFLRAEPPARPIVHWPPR